MFCEKCGEQIQSDMMFCGKCGHKIWKSDDERMQETQKPINDVESNSNIDDISEKKASLKEVNESEESTTNYEISKAKEYYEKKNYADAFTLIKNYAESGNGEMQNLLAKMYLHGYGVDSNISRAVFWWKQAIESGDTVAKCDYAEYLLSKHPGLNVAKHKDTREAFEYLLDTATDLNKSIDMLIALLTSGRISLEYIYEIIGFCKTASERNSSLYDKKKYEQCLSVLEELRIEKEKRDRMSSLSSVSSMIASIFTIISIILIWFGFHSDILNSSTLGRKIELVAHKMLVLPQIYISWCYDYCDYIGILGFQLLFIVGVCNIFANIADKTMKANILLGLTFLTLILSLIFHMYINYTNCMPMYDNMTRCILMIIIPMGIGWLAGLALKKMASVIIKKQG